MNTKGLYDNFCYCGKYLPTPATNRFGDVPEVFCSRVCETNARRKKELHSKKVNTYREFSSKKIVLPGLNATDMLNMYGTGGGKNK